MLSYVLYVTEKNTTHLVVLRILNSSKHEIIYILPSLPIRSNILWPYVHQKESVYSKPLRSITHVGPLHWGTPLVWEMEKSCVSSGGVANRLCVQCWCIKWACSNFLVLLKRWMLLWLIVEIQIANDTANADGFLWTGVENNIACLSSTLESSAHVSCLWIKASSVYPWFLLMVRVR